uniref:Uncharacterized protein n=1 Tax=Myotis myotis TaxID=51298 RepID=A0A7J7R7E1_MYOMY|nr:hypothetical protein mMyoMyo1_010884 [Myotis myotis]
MRKQVQRGWWLPQGHTAGTRTQVWLLPKPTVKALLPSRPWESFLPSLHFSLQRQKAEMLRRSWCLQNLRWPAFPPSLELASLQHPPPAHPPHPNHILEGLQRPLFLSGVGRACSTSEGSAFALLAPLPALGLVPLLASSAEGL